MFCLLKLIQFTNLIINKQIYCRQRGFIRRKRDLRGLMAFLKISFCLPVTVLLLVWLLLFLLFLILILCIVLGCFRLVVYKRYIYEFFLTLRLLPN